MENIANNRLAKNSVFLSIRMVIVLAISLYSTRVLLRVLGVEDYGVYNVVCGFVSMFSFLNTSLSNGIQRFFNYEYGKNGIEGARLVYNTALIIQVLLAVIFVIVVESVGVWYIANKMVIPDGRLFAAQCIFQFVIASFVFNILQAPYIAAVMAHERLDFYSILSIADAFLKLAIVVILPYLKGDSLIWYGFLWMYISLLNWIVYYIYTKKNFEEIKLLKKRNTSLFTSMLGFSGWNIFGTLSSVLREQGLNLIMNLFAGTVVNAARGVAAQINGGIQSFVQNITTPVRPQVIQSYAQGNMSRTMGLTYSISKLSCYFVTMLAIPICFEIGSVLKVWLGTNIPDHTPAFAIIAIMCSYQGNLNSAISGVVHATGKMKDYQFWGSTVKLLSVPIGYILLKFGMMPESALLAVFIFDWVGHVTCLFILRKLVEFSIRDYLKKVMLPIVAVIVISIAFVSPIHFFIGNDLLRFIAVCLASVVIVFATAYCIGLQKNEKKLLREMIRSLLSKLNIVRK